MLFCKNITKQNPNKI